MGKYKKVWIKESKNKKNSYTPKKMEKNKGKGLIYKN